MAEITTECIRPKCTERVFMDLPFGGVQLELQRRVESEDHTLLAVDVWGEICSKCSNDLADWWLAK